MANYYISGYTPPAGVTNAEQVTFLVVLASSEEGSRAE